jgi:hypothetical protein
VTRLISLENVKTFPQWSSRFAARLTQEAAMWRRFDGVVRQHAKRFFETG